MRENSWSINVNEHINKIAEKDRNAFSKRFQVSLRVFSYFVFLGLAYIIVTFLTTISLSYNNASLTNNLTQFNNFTVGYIWTFTKDNATNNWTLSYTNYQYALIIIFILMLFFLFIALTYFWIDLIKTKKMSFSQKQARFKLYYFFIACLFILIYTIAILVELTTITKTIDQQSQILVPGPINNDIDFQLGHLWNLHRSTNWSISVKSTSSSIVLILFVWFGFLIWLSSFLLIVLQFKQRNKHKD